MGLITRSEAVHRLKIISTKINNAISACREGHWQESFTSLEEAQLQIEAILPHVEEASDTEHDLVASLTPNPMGGSQGIGGMGYRGSSHSEPKKKAASNGGNGIPKPIPIVTPPPPQAIITPPPVTPFDMPEPEPVVETFDMTRISGRPEFLAQFANGTVLPLTPEELRVSDVFGKLPSATQEKIANKFNETGKPVAVKLRPRALSVKES